MVDPHWTSYVGMGCGIFGAIISLISLYRTFAIKSLDLRLALKKDIVDLHSLFTDTKEIMDKALRSRKGVASVQGTHRSGAMKSWVEKHEQDKSKLNEIELPLLNTDFPALRIGLLEQRLVSVHELKCKIKTIQESYLSSIARDVKDGEFIRDRAHRNI